MIPMSVVHGLLKFLFFISVATGVICQNARPGPYYTVSSHSTVAAKEARTVTDQVIVIINDEGGESLALEKARNVSASLLADVEVVRFIPETSSDTERQSATQSTGELVQSIFEERGGVTSQVVPTDDVPRWMADHCSPGDDNLVVVTGHRDESMFHTPIDWGLIRQLHCPLLIGCEKKWRSKRNLLIALDLSSNAASHREMNMLALRWAKQWEAVNDCRLHAMYSMVVAAPLLALDIVEPVEYQRNHEPKAREKLVALLEESGMSHVIPHVLLGLPEKTIPHMANKIKADLVIIGSLGHEGIRRFLHNNTAEKVLHHLRTDMLVVKPIGASL
jgi:universal stress protein E